MMKALSLILSVLLLSSCVNYLKSYSFDEAYEAVRKIDSKYGTILHVEQLGVMMVKKEQIDPMLAELRQLQRDINNSRPSKDQLMIERFLSARMLMLESERDFQIAAQIGLRGLATDGYRCNEMDSIAKSRMYLRDSLAKATLATDTLDLVLQEPAGQRFLGVDDTKPKFYESPFRDISAERKVQKEALLKCMADAGMTPDTLEQQYGSAVMEDLGST